MSRFDNAMSWLFPERAARRERARALGAMFRAQYDMAKRRRADEGWLTPSTSANAETGPALVVTRDRARDMVRNNPYAKRIVDVWTAHIVGDGITAAWQNKDGSPSPERQEAWSAWAESTECDADGRLDYYGLQQLAVRTMVGAGEALIRRRIRRLSDGLTIPLQLQVMEPDHLDHGKNEVLKNGGVIVLGIQFSPIGRREGYWLFRNHPGDNTFAFQRTSYFVPADQMEHLYRPDRPGQVRGITWLAAVGNKIKDLMDYHDALIMKAKIESCLTGWITSPTDDLQLGPEDTKTINGMTQAFETLEPGTMGRLRPGEEVTFSEPSSGGSHEAYTRQFEQNIAIGAGLTYDQITGDLSRANFASLRAGKIEFRRDLSQIQWQGVIPMACEPVGNSFNQIGIAAGMWADDGAKAVWMPPRNEPIDPKKDTEAEISDMEAGLEPWSAVVRRRGYDPRTLADQHAADDAMLRGRGLERFITSSKSAPPVVEDTEDEDVQAA